MSWKDGHYISLGEEDSLENSIVCDSIFGKKTTYICIHVYIMHVHESLWMDLE